MFSLNLNDIQLFLSVVEFNGITAAANHHNINKSKVSRRITALEHSIGMRLINRGTGGIKLTNDGRKFVKQYQMLFKQLALAEEGILDHKNQLSGKLQVSLPLNLSNIVGDLMSDFCLQYPQIEVNCELVGQSDSFGIKDFDVAFLVNRSELPDGDYIARKLATFKCGLFASPEFLSNYPSITQVDQLSSIPCLCTSNNQQYYFTKGNQIHSVTVSGHYYIDSSAALLKAALKGLGVIRLPEFVAAEKVKIGHLEPLNLDMPSQDYQLYIAYKERVLMSAKTRAFIDFFLALKDKPWQTE